MHQEIKVVRTVTSIVLGAIATLLHATVPVLCDTTARKKLRLIWVERWNVLSGTLFIVAFLPYIWAIIHHRIAPSPISWGIWGCVDTLALIAMKKKKSKIGQIVGAVCGAWVITVLTLAYGKPTMGLVECIGAGIALLGIALWQKTGNATLALVCAQVATFAGALPTFSRGYHFPSQEDQTAWIIWLASCVFALIAIRKKWNLANALQPLTFTVIETTMVILVVIRPHLF